jgi:hypothetical protein
MVLSAAFGHEAGIIGAAALARESVMSAGAPAREYVTAGR